MCTCWLFCGFLPSHILSLQVNIRYGVCFLTATQCFIFEKGRLSWPQYIMNSALIEIFLLLNDDKLITGKRGQNYST